MGVHARYLPTGGVMYAWEGELLGRPRDLAKLGRFLRTIRPVLEDVMMGPAGYAHFERSENS